MNKQIAGRLDISEITVKVHRANGMRKLGVRSVTEFVRMIDVLALGSDGRKTAKATVESVNYQSAPRAMASFSGAIEKALS